MNVLHSHIRLMLLVCLQILPGCGGGGSGDRATASLTSSNANLSSLTVSEGTLVPTFSSTTLSYTVEVGVADSLMIAAAAVASNAKADVNGSGDAEAVINIVEGDNVIEIVVVAEDGHTTQTYSVTVTRNSAPTVAAAYIRTSVWPGVVLGDTLTGLYGYQDADGDSEGASMFRWLRDGVAIPGAVTDEHTVTEADVPSMITFEVTPVAESGETMGMAKSSDPVTTSHMKIAGFARYLDANTNSVSDAGDQLIVPFNSAVAASFVTVANLLLPVIGDDFGTGAEVSAGPAENELTITLGVSPTIRTRGEFSTSQLAAGLASGIDVVDGTIVGERGAMFESGSPADIIPGYFAVPSGVPESLAVALGDLDGDGDLDLMLAGLYRETEVETYFNNEVYFNEGGEFTLAYRLGINNSYALAVGDIDDDGDLDLVVANRPQGDEYDGGNQVYFNDGMGNLTDSGQSLGARNSFDIALGDVDGDGDLDITVANMGPDEEPAENRIYLNDGAGFYSDSGQVIGNAASGAIALGDIDDDGNLDLAVANYSPNVERTTGPAGSLQIYENDGAGFFSAGEQVSQRASRDVHFGDIDGDGDLDLVESNYIYINCGNGSFEESGERLFLHTFELLDYDDDGDLDVAVGRYIEANFPQPNKDQIFQNDGSGNFVDTGHLLPNGIAFGVDTYSLVVGDIDQDGDLDVVAGNGYVYLSSLAGT